MASPACIRCVLFLLLLISDPVMTFLRPLGTTKSTRRVSLWSPLPPRRRQPGASSPSFTTSLFSQKKTLAPGCHTSEIEVKKSRFIGYAQHATSWDVAQSFIESTKAQHPKARHWCYAAVMGLNERCSDDGEPTGTAGQPILSAIHGEGLGNVVCVVVRYFGGTKLGAGGLIRSYGAAARQVLREAPIEVLIPTSTISVTVEAAYIGVVYEVSSKRDEATVADEVYGEDGSLSVSITCKSDDLDGLIQELADGTRGTAVVQEDIGEN